MTACSRGRVRAAAVLGVVACLGIEGAAAGQAPVHFSTMTTRATVVSGDMGRGLYLLPPSGQIKPRGPFGLPFSRRRSHDQPRPANLGFLRALGQRSRGDGLMYENLRGLGYVDA